NEDANLRTVDAGAHEAATSPQNDLPEPTNAQKEAGNHKMGPVQIDGLPKITIENPAGSVRADIHNLPPKWQREMKGVHYGRILRTIGNDGDHVDVMVKEGTPTGYNGPMFVVDQVGKGGKFDEHKVMIGFDTKAEAEAAYKAQYPDGWKGMGAISETAKQPLKTWLRFGDKTEPFGGRQHEESPNRDNKPTIQKSAHLHAEARINAGGKVLAIPKSPGSLGALGLKLSKAPSPGVAQFGAKPLTAFERHAVAGIIDAAQRAGLDITAFDAIDSFFISD